jgi:hypothetical protein
MGVPRSLDATGSNDRDQAHVPAEVRDVRVTSVAAGWDHSLALTTSGQVYAWGGVGMAQKDVPTSLRGVRVLQVAAGYNRTLALTRYQGPDLWVGPRGTRTSTATSSTSPTDPSTWADPG